MSRKDNSLKPNSPYYLHPSDHPGMKICPVMLQGDNYSEWELCIRNAFRAKRKLGFVDGSIMKPDDLDEMEDWWSVNSMLVGWIIQSIDESVRSTITYFDTAKELWEDLKQHFSVGNGPRVNQLRSDLARCVQGRRSVAIYFGALKKIWDELSNYQSSRRCSCGKCECNWADELTRERDEERIHHFLMGLDDAFATVRSHILAQDPLPNLNRAYALVIQDERQRTVVSSRETHVDGGVFAVQARRGSSEDRRNAGAEKGLADRDTGSGRGDDRRRTGERHFCTNCNRPGHEAHRCYQLVGYPSWWSDDRIASHKSHLATNDGKSDSSRARGRGRGQANATQRGEGVSSAADSVASFCSADRAGTGLTESQFQTLLNALKSNSPNSGNNSGMFSNWILDTGASFHMTGDASLLMDVKNVATSTILLPNGSSALACQAGTIRFSDRLVLHDILLVPKLTCNLISCAQLLRHQHCVVTVTDKLCILQDRTTMTLIGAGEERNGVYWLRVALPIAFYEVKVVIDEGEDSVNEMENFLNTYSNATIISTSTTYTFG